MYTVVLPEGQAEHEELSEVDLYVPSPHGTQKPLNGVHPAGQEEPLSDPRVMLPSWRYMAARAASVRGSSCPIVPSTSVELSGSHVDMI